MLYNISWLRLPPVTRLILISIYNVDSGFIHENKVKTIKFF